MRIVNMADGDNKVDIAQIDSSLALIPDPTFESADDFDIYC